MTGAELERMRDSNPTLAHVFQREIDRRMARPPGVDEATSEQRKAKPDPRRGEMNGVEARFAREWLEPRQQAGEIIRWDFEPVTWHLYVTDGEGKVTDTKYTPDFYALCADGTEWWIEVKGRQLHARTRVALPTHAAARPWFRWTLVRRKDGRWSVVHDFAPRREARAA
jgi:hypothetical protein